MTVPGLSLAGTYTDAVPDAAIAADHAAILSAKALEKTNSHVVSPTTHATERAIILAAYTDLEVQHGQKQLDLVVNNYGQGGPSKDLAARKKKLGK